MRKTTHIDAHGIFLCVQKDFSIDIICDDIFTHMFADFLYVDALYLF